MIKHFFLIALRYFRRNKGFTAINIAGLSLGMAAGLTILIFVTHELSFDRFHEHARHIYRVGVESDTRRAFTPPPLAAALKADFPEIAAVTRLNLWKQDRLVRRGDHQFLEKEIIFADSSVFDVFTFHFLEGEAPGALNRPHQVVITEPIAKKYFPEGAALGEMLMVNGREWQVSGVIEPLPGNSHFHFDLMMSLVSTAGHAGDSWMSHCYFTYVRLHSQAMPEALEAKFPEFFIRHYGPQFLRQTGMDIREEIRRGERHYAYYLQPLLDIHLNGEIFYLTDKPGNQKNVLIFSAVALALLLIACINFVNLSTARSVKRAREVGIRKVVGTPRSRLFGQFFSESILMSLLSLGLALFLVNLMLPRFSAYLNRDLSVHLEQNPWLLAAFLGFGVFVGMCAGLYPAMVLSSYRPVDVLKGRITGSRSGARFRNGLVVFQFVASLVLIIATLTIGRQMQYLNQAPLGFHQEGIVIVERFSSLGDERSAFYQRMTQHPQVMTVSNTNSIPGRHFEPNGYQLDNQPKNRNFFFWTMFADHAYFDLLDLKRVEGSLFSETAPSDEIPLVINEAAVSSNHLENPLGQTLSFGGKRGRIIGVVKDFHFQSLHRPVESMMVAQVTDLQGDLLCIRVRPGGMPSVLSSIEKEWDALTGGVPVSYQLLDEDFNSQYVSDKRTGILVLLFAGMAIFIACLGMYGLAVSAAENRTREVGIRKVAGAGTGQLMLMLTGDFLKWVVIAFLIAAPVAGWIMQHWLQNFASRVTLSWWLFALAGLGTLAIALLSVGVQIFRSARANPVDSLKYE